MVDWSVLMPFLRNSPTEYFWALGVFVSSLVFLRIFKYVIVKNLKKLAKNTKSRLDDWLIDMLDVHWPFYVFLSIYFAVQWIIIPDFIDKAINYILIFIAVYYVINGFQKIIEHSTARMIEKKKERSEQDAHMIHLMSKFIKISLWIIAILFVLSNFGINVSTLIAGLGIGGIAIAFALQSVLADIFASFSIYLDKPFIVGDFIIVGTDMGTVEKIGIKTTRIKTLQGQELIVSNKELTETRVNNYKKMERRRIVFKFGVTYNTPSTKLKKIPTVIGDIFKKIKLAELDRAHWKNFGDSSLEFEIVYYVNTAEYLDYMNIQQEVNLAIKNRFEKMKIEMAYPTQTLYIKK